MHVRHGQARLHLKTAHRLTKKGLSAVCESRHGRKVRDLNTLGQTDGGRIWMRAISPEIQKNSRTASGSAPLPLPPHSQVLYRRHDLGDSGSMRSIHPVGVKMI